MRHGDLKPGPPEPPGFDEWAIVEVMGHRKFAGRVTEQVVAGHGFVRIDVPAVAGRQPFFKLFGPTSIYAITPVDEEAARAAAASFVQQPVDVWSLRAALPSLTDEAYPMVDDEDDVEGPPF